MRTFRLVVAVAAIVCLACAAYVSEYLAKSELVSQLGLVNERFRLAVQASKSVGWEWDLKTGRDYWFGDLQTMFGIPFDSFVGRPEDFYRYVHSEDRQLVAKAVADARQSRKEYSAEFRVVRLDGTVRWVAAKGSFYYSAKGDPERMLGMASDITDRKQTEEALRESEARLSLAVRAGRMYAFEWDTATDVIVRSHESANILKWSTDPTRDTGRLFLAAVHPDDLQLYTATEAGLTPENPDYHISFRLFRPDGVVIWLEDSGRAFFDTQGKMVRVVGMAADVTDGKLAEETLANVSRRLIEAQEEERTRIARELHDDIGQRVALIAAELERLHQDSPGLPAETLDRVGELQKQSSEIAADIQTLSHELHSTKLAYLGIAAAMQGFSHEFGQVQKVEVDFKLFGFRSPHIRSKKTAKPDRRSRLRRKARENAI